MRGHMLLYLSPDLAYGGQKQKKMKISIPNNIFFFYLMIINLCTVNIQGEYKAEFEHRLRKR